MRCRRPGLDVERKKAGIDVQQVRFEFETWFEIPLNSKEHFLNVFQTLSKLPKSIPLFIKHENGFIDIIPYNLSEIEIEEGCKLVYLGQEMSENLSLKES